MSATAALLCIRQRYPLFNIAVIKNNIFQVPGCFTFCLSAASLRGRLANGPKCALDLGFFHVRFHLPCCSHCQRELASKQSAHTLSQQYKQIMLLKSRVCAIKPTSFGSRLIKHTITEPRCSTLRETILTTIKQDFRRHVRSFVRTRFIIYKTW